MTFGMAILGPKGMFEWAVLIAPLYWWGADIYILAQTENLYRPIYVQMGYPAVRTGWPPIFPEHSRFLYAVGLNYGGQVDTHQSKTRDPSELSECTYPEPLDIPALKDINDLGDWVMAHSDLKIPSPSSLASAFQHAPQTLKVEAESGPPRAPIRLGRAYPSHLANVPSQLDKNEGESPFPIKESPDNPPSTPQENRVSSTSFQSGSPPHYPPGLRLLHNGLTQGTLPFAAIEDLPKGLSLSFERPLSGWNIENGGMVEFLTEPEYCMDDMLRNDVEQQLL
ncbi:hypothetical protein E1B28_007448 [Marasmius oreades]|uniref:Uncharacterized protein n=1 Tax=Marasmius oreades TaxID=181124 RepID=A0A9P7S1P2_9AGAR|nr:uncharacterized protein E1B28_007448 [Marasmius oreades]KAG7093806.1 hypothetical protein E1B28_007448 [Marasmius oreades]